MPPFRPLAERWAEKVSPEPNTGCWLWTAQVNEHGYGIIARPGGSHPMLATRVGWELHRGPIPDGMRILHKCDNPTCVNPGHLFLGTQQDNIRDMMRKRRHASHRSTAYILRGDAHPLHRNPALASRGETHHKAKITETDVRTIRAEAAAGTSSWKALAARYGVSKTAIQYIVHRRNWKHVA